ncbi:DNRLRE domain-containing protein, partial [Paenibacillus sp. Marseille-P2973]
MYRKTLSVVLAVLLLAGVVSPALLSTTAHASTRNLEVEADLLAVGNSYVGTDDTAQQLYVGTTDPFGPVEPARAALRFNLGSIPGTVTKYELQLTLVADVDPLNGNEFYIDVWGSPNNTMMDDDLVFPTFQLDGPPVHVNYNEIPNPGEDQKLSIDVTSIVNVQTDANDRNVTFVLTGNESLTDTVKMMIYSKEIDNAYKRPQLIVTYEENQPPTGSVEIAGGMLYTNTTSVNLNLTNSDPNGDSVEMRLSNDGVDWSDWEAAAATRSWTLTTGDGLKTVYYQLRDSSNAESVIYQDSITLDTIPPIITGVTQGGLYNTDITITSDEGTATLNGIPFVLGGKVSTDGNYTLVVRDSAGNITTVSFTVDKTPPAVSGVVNGVSYNTDRTITFTEGNALLNDQPYTSGTTISAEGSYTLVVSDAAGNATTVS